LNLGFQIAASIPPYAASAAAAFTVTATVSVTSTSIPSSSPSNTSNSLGIGLGIALGVVLLAAAVVGIVLYERHRVRQQGDGTKTLEAAGLSYYAPKNGLDRPNMAHEAPSWTEPVEMHAGSENS